jgi:hypothetical protein
LVVGRADRAENRPVLLQRFRKYSSSLPVQPAGFAAEKHRIPAGFSAAPGGVDARFDFIRSFSMELSARAVETG